MIDCITSEKVSKLRELISGVRKVTIAAHTHPDGDAIGSVTALALYLSKFHGIDVTCCLPDEMPESIRFAKAPGIRYMCGETPQYEDLLFLLDCNAFKRTEVLQGALEASKAPKVLIDHHLDPDQGSFNLVFSTPEISSASELVFWVLKALGWDVKDTEVGSALLTGMTTDTNNFANSVFPTTLAMASELIAAGVDRDAILQKLYNSYRENRVRLFGYMQYHGLTILPEGAAYMIITKEIQEKFDMEEGESEGLVNVPLAVGNVRISLLLKEDGDYYRVSLRSKKGTSAQQCAVRFFNGGGHENAAGGKLFPAKDLAGESLESYIKKALLEALR